MENETKTVCEMIKSLRDRITTLENETRGDYSIPANVRIKRLEGERAILAAMVEENRKAKAARQSAETTPDNDAPLSIYPDRVNPLDTRNDDSDVFPRPYKGKDIRLEHATAKLRADAVTIKDQAATVDALMGENAELFDQCDANADTIATLKTDIMTRDRLLDDQAATIGKLEDKLSKTERDTKVGDTARDRVIALWLAEASREKKS